MTVSIRSQAWGHVALYAGLIFFLSSLERPLPMPDAFKKVHADWFFHVVEYGVFGALLARALRLSGKPAALWRVGAIAFLIGCLYGATDEWHQSFVPSREVSVWDWTADTGGAFLGTFLWLRKEKERKCLK